ncbi:MAG: hypothetical protein JST00_02640 [Deltaproteobacteria bacterium]|nr:hypothetical protein [Deltaproteobacteria bacterium]
MATNTTHRLLALLTLTACGAPAPPYAPTTPEARVPAPALSAAAAASTSPRAMAETPPAASPSASASAKAPPTDAEIAARYTPVWRTLLAKRNAVSLEAVDRATKVTGAVVYQPPGSDVVHLIVQYVFLFDWLEVPVNDSVLARPGALGPSLQRPGDWLEPAEAEEIGSDPRTAALAKVSIARLPFGQHPKFRARAEALAAMRRGTGASFEESQLGIERPLASSDKLEISLRWVGTLGRDACIEVRANLSTGAIERHPFNCGVQH